MTEECLRPRATLHRLWNKRLIDYDWEMQLPVETIIHRYVSEARDGRLGRVIAKMQSGWAVLGDPQVLRGYCVLLPDPVVTDLHVMSEPARQRFLVDMGMLGQAVAEVTGAERINYEMLGNVEPALHAHVIPRYSAEPANRRQAPVWFYDWDQVPAFDAVRDGPLLRQLHDTLTRLNALDTSTSLREIPQVRQVPGEARRRWFSSVNFDLIVWLNERNGIDGFQLCYDKTGEERALTWRHGTGFSHAAVDSGEDRTGKYKSSPILVPDGRFDGGTIAARFKEESTAIDPGIAGFVFDKLMGCDKSPPAG